MSRPEPESRGSGVRLEVDGPVATVVLDNPATRNAQTPQTWEALAAIGDSLDPEVRVVVVRGAGPSFSAGLDRRMLTPEGVPGGTSFAELVRLDDDALADRIAQFQRAFTWWRRPGRITIAAVHGHAVGAGFQLALACDLRLLADDAQLCMREPALGLVPDLGGTKVLVDLVGYSRALEICATSRWVHASEAVELGLATVVVPRGAAARRRARPDRGTPGGTGGCPDRDQGAPGGGGRALLRRAAAGRAPRAAPAAAGARVGNNCLTPAVECR
jgi:enoyl-CoA hydratase/carnithine racemase